MRRNMKRFLSGLLVLVLLLTCVPVVYAANAWDTDLLAVYWEELPVYDGTGKEPKPVVAYQGLLLAEGRDYVLTYSNNVNSGNQAEVTITGKGAYEGNFKTVEFVILPAEIEKCQMEFAPAVYCGAPVEASSHSIRDSKGNVLKENVDYMLVYSENAQVGEGKVRVIGLGNYTGCADRKFTIAAGTGEIVSDKFYVDLSADQDLDGKEYYLEAGSRLVLVMEASPNITELNVNGKPHPYFDPNALELYYNNIEPGNYDFQYTYLDQEQKTHSSSFSIHVVRTTPVPASKLIAGTPIRQGSRTVYLQVRAQKETEVVTGAAWNCTTSDTAEVTKDGIAVLKQPGIAMFSASMGVLKASCGMDVDPWDLSREGKILNYDAATGKVLVTWKNEILTEDVDYCVTITDLDGASVVMVEGMNLFTGILSGVYYPLTCSHYFEDAWDTDCGICGAVRSVQSVQVDKKPAKLTYAVDEKLDLTGGTLKVTYDDGAEYTVPMTEEMVQGSTEVPGEIMVSICYQKNGQTVKEDGYLIQVTAPQPTETQPTEPEPTESRPTEPKPTEPKPTEPETQTTGVNRIFGADRYATALKTADELKTVLGVDKFESVLVASGTDFADALAGSYLATQKNAPILLVRNRASEMDAVKAYIKKNLADGGTVYLLGGPNAVPEAMETGLDGFNVKRLGGATRYDTNLLILKEAGVAGKDIVVCTGTNFADSLSASAVGLPILLVKTSLTDAQKNFLKDTTGKKIIIGGTAAVNANIENALKAYGTVERLAGNTRYETSVLVAKFFFRAPKQAVLAYAQNFPDGLCGGALAYQLDSPLILTATGKDAAAVSYAADNGIRAGYALGGTGLISDQILRKVFAMAADAVITVK